MLTDFNRRKWLSLSGAAVATSSPRGAASGVIRVRSFGPDGGPSNTAQLRTLMLTDRNGRPFPILPEVREDGTATIELPAERFEMMMIQPLRGFGQVYLYADDGGGLYSSPAGELVLNYEFARSRAAYVERYVASARKEGVVFGPDVTGRLERGKAALGKASEAHEPGARAGHADESLAETMWAGEMAAVERARQRINKNDTRPGFLFGCNAFEYAKSEQYASLYAALLNFATLPFYRASTEKVEFRPDYSAAEGILGKLAGTRMVTKGHPLVWFHSAGIPEFLRTKSWRELRESCRDYILRSVGRFRGRIHSWDVINEAHDWANELNLTPEQLLDMTRLAAETCRVADPTAFRVVNSCCTWSEYVATGRTYKEGVRRPVRSALDYVRAVEESGVPYEAIGLQLYNPQRDMLEIERQLERFLVFGKPVHITELGISSSSEPVGSGEVRTPGRNVWHGTEWTEQIQADWAEQFYTICYSKPEIQAITWWDFADPAFIPHGGFLDKDMRPKEAYRRLAKLLLGWQGTMRQRLEGRRI